jgi:DNA-binding XRE family transcriptional regulator
MSDSLEAVVRKLELLEARVKALEGTRADCPTGGTQNRLKVARVSRGMTQRQLAEAIGKNEIDISRYEVRRAHPDKDTKERIAAVMGMKTWELFDS